ncbi:MAG: heme A synthase [Microbacteriaceae bacterium]|nr:heme A synthase [Microbacteriaceae bacterium]
MVSNFWQWLPTVVDRRVRAIAWVTLTIQIVVVGTGGAVRLTGSGLGCPTWPRCTVTSVVSTPELGIHGVIEFANRLLTFVIALIAVVAFLYVVRLRRRRRDLFGLSIAIGAGIPAQAVLGGITVLTGLDPWLVGAHFLLSTVIVMLSAIFLVRAYYGAATHRRVAPRWFAQLSYLAAALVTVAVLLGIVTTGSGPHAGDINTPRNGLNSEVIQLVHSYPAYLLLAVTILLVLGARRLKLEPARSYAGMLLLVEVGQVVIGIVQARLGLPIALVNIHLVLACLLVTAMTAVILSLSLAPLHERDLSSNRNRAATRVSELRR